MYQEFFRLLSRPFSTHGGPSPFVSTPATEEPLAPLMRFTEDAGGIGILSAPTGTGKTAIALELIERVKDRMQTVYIGSSNFSTRRGLLQAILFEMGLDYAQLSEQEARLQLIDAVRSLPTDKAGLLLVIDEAHQLGDRMFEELRSLVNAVHAGRPLIRLLLVGQIELDEKLADPEMDAFNQRVACHVVLEPLSREQTAEYLRCALTQCGGRLSEIFTEEALSLICHAGDGNLRGVHQLCDHSLLLAYVSEERPVSAATVRAALEDLQELPAQWNIPAAGFADSSDQDVSLDTEQDMDDSPAGRLRSDLPVTDDLDAARAEEVLPHDAAEVAVVEFGGDATPESDTPMEVARESADQHALSSTVVALDPHEAEHSEQEQPTVPRDAKVDASCIEQRNAEAPRDGSPAVPESDCVIDEPLTVCREYELEDRYAMLDRSAELRRMQSGNHAAAQHDRFRDALHASLEADDAQPGEQPDVHDCHEDLEGRLLEQIGRMRDEIQQLTSEDPPSEDAARIDDATSTAFCRDEEWDVIQPEPEDAELSNAAPPPQTDEAAASPAAREHAATHRSDDGNIAESVESHPPTDEPRRRYAFLFTRLRERRRAVAECESR